MSTPEEVLSFWLDKVGPSGWYKQDADLDQEIRDRFMDSWRRAKAGELTDWMCGARNTLAYLILADQFPRNMFRGSDQAFATDRRALAVAKCAISRNWDLRIEEPQRQFFYLPLMHSESISDQERCVRLMKERLSDGEGGNLLHARVHREVIRQFGRFPYRNEALARRFTKAERDYIAAGGYGETLRSFQMIAAE